MLTEHPNLTQQTMPDEYPRVFIKLPKLNCDSVLEINGEPVKGCFAVKVEDSAKSPHPVVTFSIWAREVEVDAESADVRFEVKEMTTLQDDFVVATTVPTQQAK